MILILIVGKILKLCVNTAHIKLGIAITWNNIIKWNTVSNKQNVIIAIKLSLHYMEWENTAL